MPMSCVSLRTHLDLRESRMVEDRAPGHRVLRLRRPGGQGLVVRVLSRERVVRSIEVQIIVLAAVKVRHRFGG